MYIPHFSVLPMARPARVSEGDYLAAFSSLIDVEIRGEFTCRIWVGFRNKGGVWWRHQQQFLNGKEEKIFSPLNWVLQPFRRRKSGAKPYPGSVIVGRENHASRMAKQG
jgi:hypothetical protein